MNARRSLAAAALLALAGPFAGCGGDDESGSRADTSSTSAPAAMPTTGTGGANASPTTIATTPAATATTANPTTTAPRSERERIADCLTREGYRLQGGLPPGGDSASPDYQIIFSGPRGGGYIGFYKNASRARRVAAQLRRNAERISGTAVERHGAINIVWVDLADQAARAHVRDCLVT